MAVQMTSHERFTRMFQHKEADRVPVIDGPWGTTIERWHQEGMPRDTDFVKYFDLDKTAGIGYDISPRWETKTVEDNDDYTIYTDAWGVTIQTFKKHSASTPEFLDYRVTDRAAWEEAKARMDPSRDRVNWDHLKQNFKTWREEGYFIETGMWFGFDATHNWMVGTERLLMMLNMEPELCWDIFNTCLDRNLALLDMIWDEGYHFDSIFWCDDMGYKNKQFFGLSTYRELLKPVHKRAIEWAHSHGIFAHMHSCGNINPIVPELVEIGVDCLNPLEVKAGMDPVALKKQFGDKLAFHGGVDALLWYDIDAFEAETRRILPIMKENGGYIFSTDHSVPSCVSLKDFGRIVEVAKEVGKY